MSLRNQNTSEPSLILLSVAWTITVVGGLVLLFVYQTTADETGNPAKSLNGTPVFGCSLQNDDVCDVEGAKPCR